MDIRLVKIKEVSVDPNMARCMIGSKFSQGKYLFADLCMYHKGIPATKTFIHSEVLKEALLSNPELMKEIGLKVIDLEAELKKDLEAEVDVPEDIPVPEEAPVQKETSPEYSLEDLEELPYPSLLAYAKERGLSEKGNPKKTVILDFLKTLKE